MHSLRSIKFVVSGKKLWIQIPVGFYVMVAAILDFPMNTKNPEILLENHWNNTSAKFTFKCFREEEFIKKFLKRSYVKTCQVVVAILDF